jgi:hypothetical protein
MDLVRSLILFPMSFVTFAGGSVLVVEEAFSIVIGIQGHHEEFKSTNHNLSLILMRVN